MSTARIRLPQPSKRQRTRVVPTNKIDVRGLEHDLKRSVEGEVRFDRGSLGMYAVDASNYRQVPIGVGNYNALRGTGV